MLMSPATTRVVAAAGLAVSGLLIVAGQRMLVDDAERTPAALWWVGGLVLLVAIDGWLAPAGSRPLGLAPIPPGRLRPAQWILVAAAAAGGLAVWLLAYGRSGSGDYRLVACVWLLSIAAVITAAAWGGGRPALSARRLAGRVAGGPVWVWTAALAIVALALVLRLVALDRSPAIIDHDGTSLGMLAVAVRDGTLTNPFTTGWLDHPTLFAYFQAAALWLFGDSLAGLRALSALFGAGAVLFTWLFVRRLFPGWVALLAALLLAVMQYHLHFSRLALNNIADSFFLMAMLYLLDRGFVERRRLECVLGGLVLGLSQYFYFGSRLLMPLAVAWGAFLFLQTGRGTDARTSRRVRAGLAAWVAGGAVLAFLPLFANYVEHPEAYDSRADQVSVIGTGWLEGQRAATGGSTLEVVAQHVEDAVLLPFATVTRGTYHPPPPLLGLPLAILAAAGIAVATVRFAQRRYFPIAVSWWAAIAGVGLTQDLTSPRFVIATPLVAVAAAVALWRVHDLLGVVLGPRRVLAAGALGLAVLVLAAWSVRDFFRADRLRVYGDLNSLVATRLAFDVRDRGPGYTVYFAGAPRMSYAGFSGLAFVAREAEGADIEEPLLSPRDVPPARGRTLYVFLPERGSELRFVRSRYPEGRVRIVRDSTGIQLFTELAVTRPEGPE